MTEKLKEIFENEERKIKAKVCNMVSSGKHLYQSNVGKRALDRAGKNKNLKGFDLNE